MEKFKEFVACYVDAWRKYINFNGRATRKDFWGFFLINILVSAVIAIVEEIVGMDDSFLSSVYSLAVICPNITLTTRRLHDVNRSGWWQLATPIPLLNFYLAYLVWIKRGTEGENKFGAPVEAKPVYGAYSVPVGNEFSSYEMCPAPAAKAEPAPVLEPAAVQEAPVEKCADCGAVLAANAKFCTECGKSVEK